MHAKLDAKISVEADKIVITCLSEAPSQVLRDLLQETVRDAFLPLNVKVHLGVVPPSMLSHNSSYALYRVEVPNGPQGPAYNLMMAMRHLRAQGFEPWAEAAFDEPQPEAV